MKSKLEKTNLDINYKLQIEQFGPMSNIMSKINPIETQINVNKFVTNPEFLMKLFAFT